VPAMARLGGTDGHACIVAAALLLLVGAPRSALAACTSCPADHYCAGSSCVMCPAGTSSPAGNTLGVASCTCSEPGVPVGPPLPSRAAAPRASLCASPCCEHAVCAPARAG
jgi:hypothetical protein